MKTIHIRMLLIAFGLLATLMGKAQSLRLAEATMKPSDSSVVTTLDLQNEAMEFVGLQCDVYLPDGFSVASDINIGYAISANKSGRINATDYTVGCVRQKDGSFRILCYSTSLKPITGESGAVLDIVITVPNDIAEGEYLMEVRNIVLSRVNNKKVTPDYAVSTLTVSNGEEEEVDKGDVNGDGKINSTDIMLVVNKILDRPSGVGSVIDAAMDLNTDGKVNSTDIMLITNKILGR